MDGRIQEILAILKDAGLLVAFGGHWESWQGSGRLVHDSRELKPGDLFACVVGGRFDGHSLMDQARERAISALMVQRKPATDQVPWIQVTDVRRTMGFCAAVLEGWPAKKLQMVGVTGTNGKSTSSYMLRSILQSGAPWGLMGTVVYHDGVTAVLADRTTPENVEVQALLARMVANGCGGCVMECSSHGLDQGRLAGCLFDGVLFTNLTPEHLDYHGDMELYFQAKLKLFTDYCKDGAAMAVNVDDPYGQRIAQAFPEAMTWGLGPQARLRAMEPTMELDRSSFYLMLDGAPLGRATIPLTGTYNVANGLGAAALALAMGLDISQILRGLEKMPQVPGRMERLNLATGAAAIIDYAHTPEALDKLLGALRPLVKGRLISLFGHGGDRFKVHRSLLGQVAARWGDGIFITMDNPRTEDPQAIAKDIAAGVEAAPRKTSYSIILPRDEAIFQALDNSGDGDVVVLSGKGPEPYLEIQGVKYPYSDRETVITWAEKRGVQWR